MGFYFKRKEAVGKAISRIGCERVRRAQECLDNCSAADAIHGARKEIKKAKAVLRLAREDVSKKEFRAVQKNLRKAAQCLAKPRDAAVSATTLRDLSRRYKSELPAGAFRKLRIAFRREADKSMRRFVKHRDDKAAAQYLSKAAKCFRKLSIEEKDWAAIAPGVTKAYGKCKAAHTRAVASNTAQDFHEWRKRTKDLWHQLTLLECIWPEKLKRMIAELETVSDYLGEDHDLFVLQEAVEKLRASNGVSAVNEIELLRKIIRERQAELRGQAIITGKYFYAEEPSEFCCRLGSYWRAWQREENSTNNARATKRLPPR
jgi:CHAD domain-containing protein